MKAAFLRNPLSNSYRTNSLPPYLFIQSGITGYQETLQADTPSLKKFLLNDEMFVGFTNKPSHYLYFKSGKYIISFIPDFN